MRGFLSHFIGTAAVAVVVHTTGTVGASSAAPQLQTLPPLREQAVIIDAWTDERKALIPGILSKYGVDAWLVRLFRLTTHMGY
jgi:hypothetical protein